MTAIALTLNGKPVTADVEPRQHLGDFIREEMRLTATHLGCEHGVCGACTVLIDGQPARSCIAYPVALDGCSVTTLEGMADDPVMARLREAFSEHHALQCGFCTPGMLVMARDIVLRLPGADEATIRHQLAGNLCRCTGYVGIVAAIRQVAIERADLAPVVTRQAKATAPMATAATQVTATAPVAGPSIAISDVFEPLVNPVELTQTFDIPATPDVVFALFQDPARVIGCLPGARLTGPSDGRTIAAEIAIKLGPISAKFAGVGTIAADPTTLSGEIHGRGVDSGSATRVRARLTYRLVPLGEATRVTTDVAYVLQGPLAQVSRGAIARDLAERMTMSFAGNLSASLTGAPPSEAQPLNAGGLLLAMVRDWIKRLFGLG